MCFMLTLTFWAIYVCKQFQIRNQEKWPAVNCDGLFKTYGKADVSRSAGIEYEDMIES